MRTFWRDALVAAVAANKLAPRLQANAEEAYTCGLLHATGHLILCQAYPDIAHAMFTGFAVARGAELAEIELGAFGIDHPTVGAIWVDTLGFPETVAKTIRHATQPLPNSATPLDLALRSACMLAAAVAEKSEPEIAFDGMPPSVRARFGGGATPDAAFVKLYEALQETEPAL
jgi:HD-like signal output (HDOD) protein